MNGPVKSIIYKNRHILTIIIYIKDFQHSIQILVCIVFMDFQDLASVVTVYRKSIAMLKKYLVTYLAQKVSLITSHIHSPRPIELDEDLKSSLYLRLKSAMFLKYVQDVFKKNSENSFETPKGCLSYSIRL